MQRGWIRLALLVIAMALLLVAILIWQFSRQVNLTGMIGSGGPAQVPVPAGYQLGTFANGLEGPRFLAFGPDGTLYVAERGADRIVRLPDSDGDGQADGVEVFASELRAPHSLVFHQDAWYVGVPTGVVRLEDADGDGRADRRAVLIDNYPIGGHATRTVLFLADGRMVVSVGSSCNVCQEQDPRRAAILVYEGPNARGEGAFATGLRNAVGLTLHPDSGELWATNNGRDLMGDDVPPDTLELVKEGGHYGWPACHSGRIIDPRHGEEGDCDGVIDPQLEIQAHSAPLGLVFYDGDTFPRAVRGDLFIAYHGSWNRSIPTGYKVVRVPFRGGRPAGEAVDFAVGWLNPEDGTVSGRPVGLAVGPAGALYVSDDKGGVIYRIAYGTEEHP